MRGPEPTWRITNQKEGNADNSFVSLVIEKFLIEGSVAIPLRFRVLLFTIQHHLVESVGQGFAA